MRTLIRLLGFVFLTAAALAQNLQPPEPKFSYARSTDLLIASIDTSTSTVRQFGNPPAPRLLPQSIPHQALTTWHSVSSASCAAGQVAKERCRIHWAPLFRQSLGFLALQQSATLATDSAARSRFAHGPFFADYTKSVANQRFGSWSNSASFQQNYLARPMTGAVAAFIFIQNDPLGRDLNFQNTRQYWNSRLRALAFAAAYNVQFEVGPFSRASLTNTPASHTSAANFVLTPVIGAAFTVAEDLVDRHVIWNLEARTNKRAALAAMSLLNPNRAIANFIRGRMPWFRDARETRVAHFALPFQFPPHDLAPVQGN